MQQVAAAVDTARHAHQAVSVAAALAAVTAAVTAEQLQQIQAQAAVELAAAEY
jgi:hypothetical protein